MENCWCQTCSHPPPHPNNNQLRCQLPRGIHGHLPNDNANTPNLLKHNIHQADPQNLATTGGTWWPSSLRHNLRHHDATVRLHNRQARQNFRQVELWSTCHITTTSDSSSTLKLLFSTGAKAVFVSSAPGLATSSRNVYATIELHSKVVHPQYQQSCTGHLESDISTKAPVSKHIPESMISKVPPSTVLATTCLNSHQRIGHLLSRCPYPVSLGQFVNLYTLPLESEYPHQGNHSGHRKDTPLGRGIESTDNRRGHIQSNKVDEQTETTFMGYRRRAARRREWERIMTRPADERETKLHLPLDSDTKRVFLVRYPRISYAMQLTNRHHAADAELAEATVPAAQTHRSSPPSRKLNF
ncbi:hypothetical protein BJ508DRAFT_307488 [Ascobolus immersus RN42]|uniref:Uncharacterized protein n=1 Tax=Ascobolus immersus RN42 TaxID=1160509 RepID=A0A3N4I4H1_ASCIM|nr:hypothetical protein BJ508DRAFT_307488 [Ascobolus immersus RN42]